MEIVSHSVKRTTFYWRKLHQRLAQGCGRTDCIHAHNFWRRLCRPRQILFEGFEYCLGRCLERALNDAMGRLRSARPRPPATHRVPLGLLLLASQELTAEQLRRALDAQRSAGHGKIGEWLQALGFVSDEQVTAALARQWSCPILRAPSPNVSRIPRIPGVLLEWFVMFPVNYVPSTATLHIAFSERIDYTVLYAIERMLACRSEPCLVVPGWLHTRLQAFRDFHPEDEIVMDRIADDEFARSIRSYSTLTAASEVRLASCGQHLWARLLGPKCAPLDLFLRSRIEGFAPDPRHIAEAVVGPV